MKLPSKIAERVEAASLPTPADARPMVEHALALASQGWAVFPLRPGTKIPLLPKAHERGSKCKGECGRDGHGAHDGTMDEATIRRWWARTPHAGIGGNLGEDKIAIDLDLNHGCQPDLYEFPETRTHWSGSGAGNRHLIYAVEPGTQAARIKSGTNVLGPGVDIRAGRGSYIVLPPTPHEDTADPYTVGDEHGGIMEVLTDEAVDALWGSAEPAVAPRKTRGRAAARGEARGLSVVSGGRTLRSGPSRLTDLLADPPAEGGRNDWLTKVAGHYAKQYRGAEDLFLAHVNQANGMLPQPLDDAEVSKITDSIWDTEVGGHPERGANEDNGYLVGNGRRLRCQIQRLEGEEKVMDLGSWGTFDIEARGVALDELSRRMYWVRLHADGRQIDDTLDAKILGDDRALRIWLAQRGAGYDQPFQAVPKMPPAERIHRYLRSQNPTQVEIVPTLGWHAGLGFVTHEGVITEDGVRAKEDVGVVANPSLIERDVAPFTYGFQATRDEAVSVLRDVLTFQDEVTASVFGAWWAACLLRPQIQARSSLFPFFGVEASSESGKTNGFFDLMVQLNGNTKGQTTPTRPVLRDYSSANRNGIVWADDLDSLEPYGELLRASTSNGTAAKMDVDRSGIKSTEIVAPILITGEALGMSGQKALADRSVVVTPISPKDRRSVKGDWLQWEDVLDLKARYPKSGGGLSVLAGWLVQEALGYEEQTLAALKKAKSKRSGRHGDKIAVLLAGAALLDALLGDEDAWGGTGQHYLRVEAWADRVGATHMDKDNTATMTLIPWALQTFGFPEVAVQSEISRFQGILSPVLVKAGKKGGEDLEGNGGEVVLVNTAALAQAWARDHNNRISDRTETLASIRQQLDALGTRTKQVWCGSEGRNVRYRVLPREYSALVLERARKE